VQVLSGTCEFTLAGKKTPLRAGELLHMPPGLPHAVTATEAFSMLLVIIREKPQPRCVTRGRLTWSEAPSVPAASRRERRGSGR